MYLVCLSLGRILILDLVVADLFIHSLSGMILLYLATPFFTLKMFCIRSCFTKSLTVLVIITPAPGLTPVLSVTRGHPDRFFIPFSRIDFHLFSLFLLPQNSGTLLIRFNYLHFYACILV